MKDKDFYINHIKDLKTEDIVEGIRNGIVSLEELKDTGELPLQIQKTVRIKLDEFKAEEEKKQKRKEEADKQRREFDKIKNNINDYKPDEAKQMLGEGMLQELCEQLGIDYNVVANYDEPELRFNDTPKNPEDIPLGTDVFFWGIPSSGKTCALSVILRTMKDKYTITNPSIETKFGATYIDSLINLFSSKKTGYLPAATQKDRTQYMPFLLKRREENNYRQVSFFELSGEVFKYFYELEHGSEILEEGDRGNVKNAFNTLNLLLNSKNQKIHFFFIDYKQETKGIRDKHNLTQENYLNAAATYFRDRNDIFKKKTDAVFVIVTKADEIKGENKSELAKQFLSDNFGSFMDVIKNRCHEDRVDFNVGIFSIGDVYFKGICKINYSYAENIVEKLLEKIKPERKTLLFKILNS